MWGPNSAYTSIANIAPFKAQQQMIPRQLPFRAAFRTLPSIEKDNINLFRSSHFQPELPVTFRKHQFKHSIPAIQAWFQCLRPQSKSAGYQLNKEYFDSQPDVSVPLERTTPQLDEKGDVKYSFERLTAPLSLFTAWTTEKLANPSTFEPNSSLYLAQCDLSSLPSRLQLDLPAPAIILQGGKGDIYASSLWMGVPPTFTPLHKDPNPNLLVQLAGKKVVRMVRPEVGRTVYQYTRRLCAEAEGSALVDGAIRGEEMMVGLEREILGNFVWEGHKQEHSSDTPELDGWETTLEAGDGVFIPKGWWHSVKGLGAAEDGINTSVNWWFR